MLMLCIKPVIADNCMGQYVEAISVGDTVDITIHSDGQATAEYTNYVGVSDFVPLDHFQ